MSISYSALTNYGKATLPSVSGGLGSMNILKDPPKSIHTRRIDKVGTNMDIVQMIQDSGSRTSEGIRQFALGVNPMVSVSYTNNGNNGGQGLQLNNSFYNKSAYNPKSLGAGGFQFRPPAIKPQDLLPLSRQPRANTMLYTNPEYIDYTKKLSCPTASDLAKNILQNTLSISVKPNEVYKMETPINEPFEVKYVIQNPTMVSASSGIKTLEQLNRPDMANPVKEIFEDPLKVFATSNTSNNRTYLNESVKDTDKYTQNVITNNIISNKGRRIDALPGEGIDLDLGIHTKENIFNINYTVPSSSTKKQDYIHSDLDLKRSLPSTSVNSVVTKNIYKSTVQSKDKELEMRMPVTSAYSNNRLNVHVDDSSRSYYLPPTANKGGFDGRGVMPTSNRISQLNDTANVETERHRLLKKAANQFEGRYEPSQFYR